MRQPTVLELKQPVSIKAQVNLSRPPTRQFRHPHNAIHGCSNFMAHIGQKLALCAGGHFRHFLRLVQRFLRRHPIGNIAPVNMRPRQLRYPLDNEMEISIPYFGFDVADLALLNQRLQFNGREFGNPVGNASLIIRLSKGSKGIVTSPWLQFHRQGVYSVWKNL